MPSKSEVTYCGVKLNTDKEQKLASWINKNMPLNTLRDRVICRNRPGRSNALGYPLNPAPLPDIKIGSYFYPNGMTRWSEAWFLCTKTKLYEILSKLDSDKAGQFIMQHATNERVSETLRLLPPIALTELDSQAEEGYILPLVDERWHLQGRGTGDDSSYTWTGLFESLQTALGVTISAGTVDGAYMRPDPRSQLWNANLQENAAMLLDVIAFNLNHVVLRVGKNSYATVTPSSATSRHQSNLNNSQIKNATKRAGSSDRWGDYIDHIAPSKVKMSFVRYCESATENPQSFQIPFPSNLGYSYTLEYSTGRGISSNEKVVHNTCRGYWDTCPSASTPTNETELQNLVDKFGADWFTKHFGSYRGATTVYNGIMPWQPDGCVDVIEWHMSADDCYTRLHPAPLNLDAEDCCHFDPVGDESSSSDSESQSDESCATLNDIRVNITAGCVVQKRQNCGEWVDVDVV